ncbi:MAG: glycosyltransferase [Flavobacterium sp.]
MAKKRILFLGETYRADAITWMNGLREFGDFEIVTWELQKSSTGISRISRLTELLTLFFRIRKIAQSYNPDMVIAERTTSYGFLAALTGIKPIAIAQQGITDLWPHNSPLFFFKKILQRYAFKKADLIHAWGNAMANHMEKNKVNMSKVLIMPKGINLEHFKFNNTANPETIEAIVTRSLEPEYKHDVIIKAFAILKRKNIPFRLRIIGDGSMKASLKKLTKELNMENEVIFEGRLPNTKVAELLQDSNFYISMPTTEGVSASLFEAMACGCFPIVTDLPGNRSWISHKTNGLLIPSENEVQLAQEMEWAFENFGITQKAIVQNRNFVEENANYAKNMKAIAGKYHELISSKSTAAV